MASGSPNYQADIPVLYGTNGFEGQTFIYAATTDVIPSVLLPLAYPLLLGGEDNAKAIEAAPRYAVAASPDGKIQLSNVVTDYFFRCGTQQFSVAATAPTYVYRYNHTFSGSSVFGKFGLPVVCEHVACHASELPFVWHVDVPELNATFTPAELVLTDQMDAFWASFIKTGSPNTMKLPAAPEWPRFDFSTAQNLRFDTPSIEVENSLDMCNFWRSLPGFGYF
jgi:carboxylesterase type B